MRAELICLLLAALVAMPLRAVDAPAPSNAGLDKAWHRVDARAPNLGVRDVMSFILEAAGSPEYARRSTQIEAAFASLDKMQDHDPATKGYGNFCWYWHEDKPGDANAVEFVTQQSALLKLRYADHLTPAARASLDRILALSVEGISRHKVAVSYTNIFLMKTWNLLALGEALQRPELTAEGTTMLDQWIDFTAQNGISEFLSPTYYGIDLDSLGLMSSQLHNPTVQEKTERILRLFWTNIAANWFEPAKRLGGAHGRDYDYLTGHGDLDRHLAQAGWISPPDAKPVGYPVFAEASRWLPPAALYPQALSTIPRFVFQRWDAPPDAWASQYVGHHFSIGVTGSSRGPEDKPFALNLAGPTGSKMVMVNFFMDGRGDPYGHIKVPTGASGHMKAHHLVSFFSAVQSGPEVLFLSVWPPSDAPPKDKEATPVCLQSHLDLPAGAAVWTQDGPCDASLPSEALPGNICFLRLGDVAVGIRFVLATDTAGQPITAQVVNDGLALGARRLSLVHSAGPPGAARGMVAVFVRGQERLDDAGFTKFREAFAMSATRATVDHDIVNVTAAGLGDTLRLKADVGQGKVLQSEGGDPALRAAPMSVNGKEYARALLLNGSPAGF